MVSIWQEGILPRVGNLSPLDSVIVHNIISFHMVQTKLGIPWNDCNIFLMSGTFLVLLISWPISLEPWFMCGDQYKQLWWQCHTLNNDKSGQKVFVQINR